MVPASSDPAALVLDRASALPAGARVLAAVEGLEGVHLVGGAVRDLLLRAEPRELDVLAEHDGPALAGELARRLGGEHRVHEAFGTATVDAGDVRVDVATARAERYPRPGALPEVRPAGLAEDLARRDFTVNAIAVGLSGDRRGSLHAFPGALDDLAGRRLRVLHEASFADDPTRLLRLVRYAARLGFAIDPHTAGLARAAFAAGAPQTAGPARMGAELRLLLAEPRPSEALALLAGLGGAGGLDVDPAVVEGVLGLLPRDASREHALLGALARGRPREAVAGWLAAMHVPDAERALDAADDPEALAAALRAAGPPSELARAARGRRPEAVAVAGALGAAEPARRWLDELRHVRLDITGDDLLAAGVAQGPEVGRRLGVALARKLDEGLSGREAELEAALGA